MSMLDLNIVKDNDVLARSQVTTLIWIHESMKKVAVSHDKGQAFV